MALAPLSSMQSMFQNITQMPAMNSWRISMPKQSIKGKHSLVSHQTKLGFVLGSATHKLCDLYELFNLSEPWFPHQYNENNASFSRGCWRN